MNSKEYKSMVAGFGCLISGRPAELHHIRALCGASQRANDWLVVPLAPEHHRTGGHGTAIHAGKQSFEKNHMTEGEMLAATIQNVISHLSGRK